MLAASSSSYFPPLPPSPPRNSRRPSFSHMSHWLSRGDKTSSAPSTPAPSNPMRISNPRLDSSTQGSVPPAGRLGQGATVVRTPQEALIAGNDQSDVVVDSTSFVPSSNSQPGPQPSSNYRVISAPHTKTTLTQTAAPRMGELGKGAQVVRTPNDALKSVRAPGANVKPAVGSNGLKRPVPPPPAHPLRTNTPPMSTPPQTPPQPFRQRSFSSGSPQPLVTSPPLPPVPVQHVPLTEPPPFNATLLSNIPRNIHKLPPTRVIVSLETASATHKTTLATLAAHPSHLANYLTSLFVESTVAEPFESDTDAESVYSQKTEAGTPEPDPDSDKFSSIFNAHLASTGLLPQRRADLTAHIHIFLDRSSESYPHILEYLRTLPAESSSHPPQLIRTVSSTTAAGAARIDALVNLRDEALFLGLTDLHTRCTSDIETAQALRYRQSQSHAPAHAQSHMRGGSASSGNARSVSMHTLREREREDAVADADEGLYAEPYTRSSEGGHSHSHSKDFPSANALQLHPQGRGRSQSRETERGVGGSMRSRTSENAHSSETWL